MQITDMIFDMEAWVAPANADLVRLVSADSDGRADILKLVASEYPKFTRYFRSPPPTTTVWALLRGDETVGAVLLETAPKAAESEHEAALACLVIREQLRRQGLGSSAIVACCQELQRQGFTRVIAEWVASVPMYERLGFRVWRTRRMDADPVAPPENTSR